jgi:PAS domain S-box-containing protein
MKDQQATPQRLTHADVDAAKLPGNRSPGTRARKKPSRGSGAGHLNGDHQRTARVLEMMDDAVINRTLDGKITLWNPAAERMFGYSASEMVGNSTSVILPPDRLEEEKELTFRSSRGEPVQQWETVRLRKDGRPVDVAMWLSPLTDPTGNVIGLCKILRDITEHKKSRSDLERIMHQIEEQAALLDRTQDAIIVHDLEGRILFWNKGAERIYGWSSQEATGRIIADCIYPEAQKFRDANATTIARGEWSGEMRHVTRDRRELVVETRWSLWRDKDHRPKSILAIKTDVTEKRRIEVQFMKAQRMESLGILAGGIAHDLNNILTPIMLSIDMLKGLMVNDSSREILETIELSARRGSDIVQQVLSFARGLEGQRIVIQPKYLLKDIEHIVKDTFPRDIRLNFTLPHDTWTIIGDPTQVQQVLLNLCVNARDAMPNGGTLSINAENCFADEHYVAMNRQAKPGSYVAISVSDVGTGIPPEIMDKIFEPFFSTKDVGKGTGLGLSSVQAIVKSHDGFINVYSEPGRGTTFKVYLPAQIAGGEFEDVPAEEITLQRGKGETILVVDDEASILSITSQTLDTFGYDVVTASNGAEAVAIYAQMQKKIAVILTDLSMPVMDGRATIYALLKINPKAKIIAMSGLDEAESVAMASGAGIKHFISKPYTAGTLLKTLRAIVEQ